MSSARQLAPRYSATELDRAMACNPLSLEKWNALQQYGDLLLTRAEAEAITANLSAALSYSTARLTPATDEAFITAIALVLAMPAQAVNEAAGDAALAGYRIGVGDMPGDLLLLAVHRALRDPARKFRPSPPELRAYVRSEMQDRERAHGRLLRWTGAPKPDVEPDQGPAPSQQDIASVLAAAYAKIDAASVVMMGRRDGR